MSTGELVEVFAGESPDLAIPQRGDGPGAGSPSQHRHLAHNVAGWDLGD